MMFQSPRTGKFESNLIDEIYGLFKSRVKKGFNPLERGNSNQMVLGEGTGGYYEVSIP